MASFAALSELVQGGCTAFYVISVPLVLCSSLFGTLVFLGMFYSIVFHSIRFDLNSATVYVFYSYLFCSNSNECIPFSFGGGLCLGLYLACTTGCTLLLDHFWLPRPPVPPVLLGCSWRTARARGETEPMRRAEGNRAEARRPGGPGRGSPPPKSQSC